MVDKIVKQFQGADVITHPDVPLSQATEVYTNVCCFSLQSCDSSLRILLRLNRFLLFFKQLLKIFLRIMYVLDYEG